MPEYLQQDLINPRGYVARTGRPKVAEAAVALTDDGCSVCSQRMLRIMKSWGAGVRPVS